MATIVSPEPVRACKAHAAAAARASWCGQLCVGTFCVPVKAYAAVAAPPEVPLRQLHAGCGRRIEYRKWCPQHGAVSPEQIVKGYPYQPDQYVELSVAELAELQPSDEKTIRLEHFLDPALLDLVLLAGRSLYLAPAHPAACRPFATVCQAMQRSGKWGIGRVVFSGRWQIVAVRPADQVLLMHTLHHPAQRRALAAGDVEDVQVPPKELRPLLRIIDSVDGEIPWEDYRDDMERRLTRLVEAKVNPPKRARTRGSNGRTRSSVARSTPRKKPQGSKAVSRSRRKAA